MGVTCYFGAAACLLVGAIIGILVDWACDG